MCDTHIMSDIHIMILTAERKGVCKKRGVLCADTLEIHCSFRETAKMCWRMPPSGRCCDGAPLPRHGENESGSVGDSKASFN